MTDQRTVWDDKIEALALRLDKEGRKPFALDVGAFDGYWQSAFWYVCTQWGWPGLMIEPVARHFGRLAQTYATYPWVQCHRGAISDRRGWLDIRAAGPEVPTWQQGSSTAVGTQPDMTSAWPVERVPCHGLQMVLDFYQVDRLDAVSIDTEGMDWLVLSQLDVGRYKPSAIKAEINLLSDSDRLGLFKWLAGFNYEYEILSDVDVVAWPREAAA